MARSPFRSNKSAEPADSTDSTPGEPDYLPAGNGSGTNGVSWADAVDTAVNPTANPGRPASTDTISDGSNRAGSDTEQLPVTHLPASLHPDDPDDEWVVAQTGRTIKVRALTGGLLIVIVLAGGFWGGVVAEKHHGSSSSAGSSALAAAFSRLRTGATGATGTGTGATGTGTGRFTGGAGGAAGATTGTVIGVQGDILDVSDANGNLVKVTIGPSTTITRTATATLPELKVGDTVIVLPATGSTSTSGSVTAASVRDTAQGVSTGFTGGAGTGGGGAGFSGAGAGGG